MKRSGLKEIAPNSPGNSPPTMAKNNGKSNNGKSKGSENPST